MSDVRNLVERLRQIAESQRMDLDSPNVAATLDDAATTLEALAAIGSVVAEEPEGFYVIPNRDAPDQDSLWDGTIHPTREAAQASLNDAVIEWGQDAANYHVVAMVPVEQGDDDERS